MYAVVEVVASMKIIKELISQIHDEVKDANKYIECALKYRDEDRGLADTDGLQRPQDISQHDVRPSDGRLPVKEEKRDLSTQKLLYRPHSNGGSLNSVSPAAFVEAMDKTLAELEKEVGPIDEFVMNELGYDTLEQLYDVLKAEQIDSVALAISQMKKGGGFIIGDQTGVGKGRQVASLLRWAVRQGKKPIFMTENPGLFADMHRDLTDIGCGHYKPFIINGKNVTEEISVYDEDGNFIKKKNVVIYKKPSDAEMERAYQTGKVPDGYDIVMCSYAQVNVGDEESRKYQKAIDPKSVVKPMSKSRSDKKSVLLRKLTKDNYIIMDESHKAAGKSNTGYYFQSIINDCKAVTFSSATYAKKVMSMPMYALRTAMGKANVTSTELVSIIEKGGVPLQEIMAKALADAGQMVRRERDMSDVQTEWKTISDPELVKKSRAVYDATIAAFNGIIDFQRNYIRPYIEGKANELAEMGGNATESSSRRDMGISNPDFASKTFQYTKQIMLALKVDAVVAEVEKEIKAGNKPVIALENTLGTAYSEYGVGTVLPNTTFEKLLLKGLDNVLYYRISDYNNNRYLSDEIKIEKLSPEAQAAYQKLVEDIHNSTKDLFISPIDLIVEKLNEKGYSVGELTGRQTMLTKNDNGEYVVKNRYDKDKGALAKRFNSGELDVLILNSTASTGISLHASERFKDQRPRTMIIAQALSDIALYMQMIGRIDRTGQVHRGKYINLGLPVPAEHRFLMMLSTKLKSLNANTTSSQSNKDNDVDAPDLLNKYGAQAMFEFLADNPEYYDKMRIDIQGRFKDEEEDDEDSVNGHPEYTESNARYITGRAALLPTSEQEYFYKDIVARYNDIIDYLNSTDNNDLIITPMKLDAKTLTKTVSTDGVDPEGNNPFAQNSYLEHCEVNVLKKPFKSDVIKSMIKKMNGGEISQTKINSILEITDKERDEKLSAENERFLKALTTLEEDVKEKRERLKKNTKMTDDEKQSYLNNFIKEKTEEIENKEKHIQWIF